ncbi:MAG: DNA internalization-related competence protein ComEC/Rec2 [Zoogloeaceae bacterium]|jgi:competence protein ComEC|nr:DNA internalization-related competence protein ComEC/Rec2 [Zoogloeaceae bacterium]
MPSVAATENPAQAEEGKVHPGAASSLFLIAFAVAVACLQRQASLPEAPHVWLLIGLALTAVACRVKSRVALPVLLCASFLAGGITGWGYAAWRAELRIQDRLESVWEGRDIRVIGTVASLPADSGYGRRFEFRVEETLTEGARLPERLLLSFPDYSARGGVSSVRLPEAGERWEWTVRLKRPHGSLNPYGFDYEAWLLERNLGATGYVRPKPEARFLERAAWPPMLAVHRLRAYLRERFQASLGSERPYAGILIALAVGDQGSIPRRDWDTFNRTGTTHLMSISGLHVTLVAGFAGALIGGFWRRHPRLCHKIPAQQAAIFGGAFTALAYGALSGLSVPAERACVMLTAAAIAFLFRRRAGIFRILLLALFFVLLVDTWAPLAPGFWLSFGIVAALCWAGQRHGTLESAHEFAGKDEGDGMGFFARLSRWARLFSVTQWAATLASLPLLLLFFQRFPLISPLANLFMIPWVSFVTTPLALLAALFVWLPSLSWVLLVMAHALLVWPMDFLKWLAAAPQFSPGVAPLWAILMAALGVAILLLPRRFPGKAAGFFLLLPLILYPSAPPLPEGTVRLTVFDVGQGQSVLLETSRHVLLYDAGPAYGRGGRDGEKADAGERVVLPYLAARGIHRLDAIVVSHKDSDHAGGLESLRAGIPMDVIFSSAPQTEGGKICRQGDAWQWDGIRFEFLHPEPDRALRGENNDSCVLKVSAPGGRLLFTGDIDKRMERRLIAGQVKALSAEILLVPHHGSRTSSSWPFVAAVGPEWALISAGYQNRFSHPHPEVVERYETLDARLLRTDHDGALTLTVHPSGIEVERFREREKRYWR